jgi:anthranilate phosphoribosyltransferase
MSSSDGRDEFSPRTATRMLWWDGSRTGTRTVDPADLLTSEDRRGPWGPLPPAEAAEETERILAGGGGARRGSVLLTVGAALWVTGRAPSLGRGVERASATLDAGAPERLLADLRETAAPFAPGRGG